MRRNVLRILVGVAILVGVIGIIYISSQSRTPEILGNENGKKQSKKSARDERTPKRNRDIGYILENIRETGIDRDALKRRVTQKETEEESTQRAKERVSKMAWEYTPVYLEQILSEEREDAVRASTILQEAEQYFDAEGIKGTNVLEVKCGESICRSIQVHQTEEDFTHFRDRAEGPWAGGKNHGTSKELDGGKVQSTLYFSIDGDISAFDEAHYRIIEMQ